MEGRCTQTIVIKNKRLGSAPWHPTDTIQRMPSNGCHPTLCHPTDASNQGLTTEGLKTNLGEYKDNYENTKGNHTTYRKLRLLLRNRDTIKQLTIDDDTEATQFPSTTFTRT